MKICINTNEKHSHPVKSLKHFVVFVVSLPEVTLFFPQTLYYLTYDSHGSLLSYRFYALRDW